MNAIAPLPATLSPVRARELVAEGAVLVDIREADEHRRVRIRGARNVPLSSLTRFDVPQAATIIFHCRAGTRTSANADRLSRAADCRVFVLDGGIEAWQAAGQPVEVDRRQPIELQRQVQIVAGSLMLLGLALGLATHPAFFALAAAVGTGLIVAGITGWCGMAQLLHALPWNRRA